jgi:hypothetical protein
MPRIPIEVQKIKATSKLNGIENTEYLVQLIEKGTSWEKTIICSYNELVNLRDKLNEVINKTSTAEKMGVSEEEAKKLDHFYLKDKLCLPCSFKYSGNCITCLFKLQSPLERKLFLELKKGYIRFDTQYAINWKGENISTEGKSYNNPVNNFKDVLTVADFYIEKKDVQLCIYTDGHTYHEKTEEQAQRDKQIDRKLQELGYIVLRYTGKDVNESSKNIIAEIKKWIA